jgi:hypothetical protein
MHSSRNGLHSNLVAATLALMLMVLWLLMQGYQGFAGDAQIYAYQALAKITPALSTDLYLQNTSQDQYTIFSPFYAAFIGWLGVDHAARLLTLFFAVCIAVSAWNLAAALTDKAGAWLAVAFLLIVSGEYGASGVFHIDEQFLTARLPAQALIIAAFACHTRGMKAAGLLIAVAALFIHPLMALPGLLVLLCLWLPLRVALVAAIAGVFATLGIALSTSALPPLDRVFEVMDAQWLEVVQERSQFLFLQLWTLHDWDLNVRPLIYLAGVALVLEERRARRFCVAALLVGTCGLVVGLIAGLIGPVAILVQSQAWRWVWVACLISVLLLPATVLRVWREEKCGPLCAVLLICGWVIPAVGGTACVMLAIIFWLHRKDFSERAAVHFRWMAAVGAVAGLAWVFIDAAGRGPATLSKVGNLMAVKISAAVLFGFLWWWLQGARTVWRPAIVSAVLLIGSIFIVPASFKQARVLASESQIEEFSDWSGAIPPTSTVLVAPPRDVGAFVWFTLKRPNYLALDQSAGVVFSRETALEVRRRSELLLPLMDPTWKILSGIRRGALKHPDAAPTRPLTAQSLVQVCNDPKLGFVIAPQDVGFDPRRHQHAGAWKDWNLYDCAHVRSQPKT